MNYQLPEVYEPTSAADLRRHYAAVIGRRNVTRPVVRLTPKLAPKPLLLSAPSQFVAVVPVPVIAMAEQQRLWMLAAHAELRGHKLAFIMQAVSEVMGVPVPELLSHTRRKPIAFARQVFFYMARTTTSRGWCDIGRIVGKDHSTIIHGVQKIGALRPAIDPLIDEINSKLEGKSK